MLDRVWLRRLDLVCRGDGAVRCVIVCMFFGHGLFTESVCLRHLWVLNCAWRGRTIPTNPSQRVPNLYASTATYKNTPTNVMINSEHLSLVRS